MTTNTKGVNRIVSHEIEEIVEEYKDIIQANQQNYPLTEDEYEEHIQRFKKAMEMQEMKEGETNE